MRTFSVAEQSIVEPDTGIAFQFIPDVDGDSAQNVLRLTRVDADPIELHFSRGGRYLRTEYVVPLDDDDLKARDDLHAANTRVNQASQYHQAALTAGLSKEDADGRQKEYDEALEAQRKAQDAYNERELKRSDKKRERGLVGDKVLPMTPPQPGLAAMAPESAPAPGEAPKLTTRDLQKMQADQSPETISRTYEPASPDHFDPKGLPGAQPENPQLPPDAQRPDSLKSYNQPPEAPAAPETARPPKEPVPA